MPFGRSAVVLLTAALCAAGGVGTAALAASPNLPSPPPSRHANIAAIEGFAPDQAQFFCRSTVEPGVKAFETLVLNHYKNSHSDGDMRGCDVGAGSEHKDGRAWDWGVDHRIAAQRADGKSMLRWLFATDANGDKDAMFRRLGLMYVIWNKQIWGAWAQRWEPYSCSGATACHVDHMHFSFGWAGAEEKTSYWTGKAAPVIEPPLPRFTTLHGHRALHVAPNGSTEPRWLVKGGDTYRLLATGLLHRGGSVVADARCTKTAHGWSPSRRGGVNVGGDQLQSWGEQWVPTHDNGRGCNTTNHTYRLVLTPASSSTVIAQLPGGGESGSVRLGFTRTV